MKACKQQCSPMHGLCSMICIKCVSACGGDILGKIGKGLILS